MGKWVPSVVGSSFCMTQRSQPSAQPGPRLEKTEYIYVTKIRTTTPIRSDSLGIEKVNGILYRFVGIY